MTPFKELLITIVLACAVPLIPHTQDVIGADLQRVAKQISPIKGIDAFMQTFLLTPKARAHLGCAGCLI